MIEVVCNPFLSEKKKSMAHTNNQEGVFLGNGTKVRNEQAEDDCDGGGDMMKHESPGGSHPPLVNTVRRTEWDYPR